MSDIPQPATAAQTEPRNGGSLRRGVRRIQLSRKKGWKMPPNTVKVARPTKYGNPHKIGWCPVCGAEHTREEAVAEFRAEALQPEVQQRIREELGGKNVACFCGLDEICHGDVLLEIANPPNAVITRSAAKGSSPC